MDLTLHKSDRYENTSPSGLYSDGEKLYVADNGTLEGVFVYDLETGEFESRTMPWSVGTYVSNWNFRGLWGGDNKMLATNSAYIFSYNLPGITDGQPIMTSFTSDGVSWGVWSDGETLWATQGHSIVTTSMEPDHYVQYRARETVLNMGHYGNNHPRGIWSDGETMWVVDDQDDKIYAYDMDTYLRLPGYDINVLQEAGNNNPTGIWSNDGETLWVADSHDDVIYTYRMPSNARLDSLSFSDIEPKEPFNSRRLDYGTIVVPSVTSSTTVTAVAVSDGASVTIVPEDADAATEGHQVALTTGANEIEVTVTVGGTSLTYSLVVKRSSHAAISDDTTLASLSVDETDIGTFDSDVHYYFGPVANSVSQVTLRYAPSDPTVSLSVTPGDADATMEGHQVNLTAGAETTVTFELKSSDETAERSYRVALGRDGIGTGARLFTHEFRFLDDNSRWPLGLWSDGTTMWTTDVHDNRAFAYDMVSKKRVPDKDITGWKKAGDHYGYVELNPSDQWSDGSTVWLISANGVVPRIVSIDVETNQELYRSSNLESKYGLKWPSGLWSDGTTLWVLHADWGGVNSIDTGLYAFDLETMTRLPSQDVPLSDTPSDRIYGAMWSDGETIWITNTDRIEAFDLSSGERRTDLDLELGSHNGNPWGVWSDGEVMWVADSKDRRVYAYRLSVDTSLSSLSLEGVDFGEFSRDSVRYSVVVPSGVSEVTVSAVASDELGVVSISPVDGDESKEGHQIVLESGSNVVEVMVSLEGESRLYTLVIERSVHEVLSGDGSLASLSVVGADVGEFDVGVGVYEGFVADGVSVVTVSAVASDSTAVVSVSPQDADEDVAGHQVVVGSGVVEVVVSVVSSDGRGRSSYVVRLARDSVVGGRRALFDVGITNGDPGGLWSDGVTLWVADGVERAVFAYGLESKDLDRNQSLASLFVDLDELPDVSGMWHAGNANPEGLWSDGVTLWVADSGDERVYAYDLGSGVYDRSQDVDLSVVDGIVVGGLWSDGSTLWVVDTNSGVVYGFDLVTGARDVSADFVSLSGSEPWGVWSNGATFWVGDSGADVVYAYDVVSKERIAAFDVALGSGNGDARGIWSDGSTLWVADNADGGGMVFAYRMHPGARLGSLTLAGVDVGFEPGVFDYAVTVPNSVSVTTVAAAAAAEGAVVVVAPADSDPVAEGHQVMLAAGDTTTVTVKVTFGGVTRTYSVVVTRSIHERLSSDAGLEKLDLRGGEYLRSFEPGVFHYKGFVADRVATVEARASDDTASVAVTPGDSNAGADGHQVPIPAEGTATILIDVDSSDGTQSRQYRIEVAKDGKHGDRRAFYDIDLDTTADGARGITSDGVTIWVADTHTAELVAYDLATLDRDADKDIALYLDARGIDSNTSPEGIWTDGTTVYVADSAQRHVYAYDLATGERDPDKDIGLSDLVYARVKGIWSNGVTIWVVDGGFDHTLYAYDLTTGERDPDKDIVPSYSYFPQSAWSDDATIWVADNWTDAVHAYDLDTGERRSSKDINLGRHHNNKPEGIWSNGTTIWVADHQDNKLYAYKINANPPPDIPDDTADGDVVDTQVSPAEVVNAAPLFPVGETGIRRVAENTAVGVDIGDPVTAQDDDTLSYTLGGADAESFTIVSTTGQLRTNAGLDHETKPNHSVTVTASDGSLTSTVAVTVTVTDVDEAPEITAGPASVNYPENDTTAVGSYTASDPEGAPVAWSLSGADRSSFTINDSGQLSFNTAPDYETKSSYAVIVTASDQTLHSSAIAVTVTVTNTDEAGTVTLPADPQADTALTATLTDPDSGVGAITWQWARSTSPTGPWTPITAATADTYTPTETDVGHYLRAAATYTDNHGPDKTAYTTATNTVTAAPLTATWEPPTTHNGAQFTFRLSFNKPIKLSYKNLRDTILNATYADVLKAKRVTKGSNQQWNITIRPYNTNDITITLTPSTACGTISSICTHNGQPITNTLTTTIQGP